MFYAQLLLAIRASGRRQYEIAQAAGLREGRLSTIIRRGGARPAERRALSGVLGLAEPLLFLENEVPAQATSRVPTQRRHRA